MTSAISPNPFVLPASWEALPYGDHWSFAYTTERGDREDYDFRIEFNEGVPEAEERAIIALIEFAPSLLKALEILVDGGYVDDCYHPTLKLVRDTLASAKGGQP